MNQLMCSNCGSAVATWDLEADTEPGLSDVIASVCDDCIAIRLREWYGSLTECNPLTRGQSYPVIVPCVAA